MLTLAITFAIKYGLCVTKMKKVEVRAEIKASYFLLLAPVTTIKRYIYVAKTRLKCTAELKRIQGDALHVFEASRFEE